MSVGSIQSSRAWGSQGEESSATDRLLAKICYWKLDWREVMGGWKWTLSLAHFIICLTHTRISVNRLTRK